MYAAICSMAGGGIRMPGAVIEGDDKAVRDVTDVWTYARDTRARDPNWTLIATSGELP